MLFFKKVRSQRKQQQSSFILENLEERAMMTTAVHSLAADFSEIRSEPDNETAWSLNAGRRELDHQANWPYDEQPVWTALTEGKVSQFNSASDLDFTGEFVYAVNAGGPSTTVDAEPLVIGDATFNEHNVVSASRSASEWYPSANYGSSTDDDNLEFVMQSIRWDRAPGFSINLEVEPGQPYKLQMLFAELWNERGFDIYIEGEEVLSDFITYQEQGGINKKDTGVVFTHEIVAKDNEINIRLTGDAGVSDDNPVINALTLEKLEEPSAPVWLELKDTRSESEFEGFEAGDILVRPTQDGDDYGAANLTWTSPEDTMISLSGGLWTMDDGVGDFRWRLDLNGEEQTSGTLLANEFDWREQFNIQSGSGGREAVRNLLVEKGDELRLTVIGSESEFVAVNLSIETNSHQIPRYTLGEIPELDATSDSQPISFFVDVPHEALASLSMDVEGLSLLEQSTRISFDAGLFTFTPSKTDRYDLRVAFEAVIDDELQSQQVNIRTAEIQDEFALVAAPDELPNEENYLVVGEEILNDNVFFNAANRKTRRVEISGKHVNLVPEDMNGLFERFTNIKGGVANADLQELFIYAETVVIGGELRLPGTDVTIYAKELVFKDSDGHVGQIDTTPLNYADPAEDSEVLPPSPGSHLPNIVPGQNGGRGEDAGNIVLHVDSLDAPGGPRRFILRGGAGQKPGEGRPGQKGANVRIVQPADGAPAGTPGNAIYIYQDARSIAGVLESYPTATYIQWNDILQKPSTRYGSKAFPTDGTSAIPGGTPGPGGSGGRIVSSFDLTALANVSGGPGGEKAASQPGGQGGSPRIASQIEIPVVGSWGITSRTSKDGRGWTAPAGRAGTAGRAVQVEDLKLSGWIHPAAMRAMVSFAKDAYRGGHNELATQLFNDYGSLIDEAVTTSSEFAPEFVEIRSEVATFQQQLANRLDYFGNPPGWAPSLSFAANYRAFENAIESDLKTLYLARLVQNADAEQHAKLESLTSLISELDQTVDKAKSELKEDQIKLPALHGKMQDIVVDTNEIKKEVARLEARLTDQAESNVSARNVLDTIGSLLSVIPIPSVSAIGVGISAVTDFVADPSLGHAVNAGKGLVDPFRQETLNASYQEISTQIASLDPPSKATKSSLVDYGGRLSKLAIKWAPVVSTFQEVLTASQVPANEVEAELQKLKADNAEYNGVIAKLKNLLAKKQAFAIELSQTMNDISSNLNTITTSYAAADKLSRERSEQSERPLGHETLDRVHEMERSARDRLIRYQYNLAKAYEYETLEPYPGDIGITKTFDEITRLLNEEGTTENYLNDPDNFAALGAIYENELRLVADQVWTRLSDNGPQPTSEIKLSLSESQLAQLNRDGEVTINLVESGFINLARQDVKLIEMGVEAVQSELSNSDSVQAANVQFRFEHEGRSIIQSGGTKYAFQHNANPNASSFYWSTDYDAIGGELTQSKISPSDIATLSALLDVDLDQETARSAYAHPGAWADITIRTAPDIVEDPLSPSANAQVSFQQLTLFVEYDSQVPKANLVALDVRTPEGTSPRILVDLADELEPQSGEGSFTRFVEEGTNVVLEAEPSYGDLRFAGWLTGDGQRVSSPTLSLLLESNTLIQAIYEAKTQPILGDADGDGEVGFADFLILSSNFGKSNDVVFADGDFDSNGEVDFADFLILSQAFGQQSN